MKTGIDLMIEALNKPKPTIEERLKADLDSFFDEYKQFRQDNEAKFNNLVDLDKAFYGEQDIIWLHHALTYLHNMLNKQIKENI